MNSTNNRIQVLILGFAAMAALVGGALTLEKPTENKLLVYALFSLAVPTTGVFVLLVWLSEAVRAHRVGSFLAGDVEARINARLSKLVMSWEAALWTGGLPRDELGGPSMMALLLLLALAGLAPLFGWWLSAEPWPPTWRSLVALGLPYGLLTCAGIYVKAQMPRLRNTGSVRSVWPGDE